MNSSHHNIQVIAVTGGKGGVGKTNLSVNLGIALAEQRKRVVLLDADLGLANIDVLLGLKPKNTLADVLAGHASMLDVIVNGPSGIRIVPASSGVQHMANLNLQEHAALINGFSELADQTDIMIVDTAAGISANVVNFVRACQEVIVVVCDEPSSITDAYALIKIMNSNYGMSRFQVVANMCRNNQEGFRLFQKLNLTCEKFLDVTLNFLGQIPFDENVRTAIQKQTPVLTYAPRTKAAQAIKVLSNKVLEWPPAKHASGHMEFFVEHLLKADVA